MNLVIVESPTKAKTISRFLGKNFNVLSSFGHVRDLPAGEMGVDIENNFTPKYVVPTRSRKTVTGLKKAAAKADKIYFATDQDREGEAISWHLAELLKVPEKQAARISFHEITKEAIEEALKNPRHLNLKLVDAQQARRILDRLVGYELSPFLWKKVAKGLSAGRVQSVTVRLIVEREKEINAFKAREYWTIEARLSKDEQGVVGISKAEETTLLNPDKPCSTPINPDIFVAKLYKINNAVLDKFDIPTQSKAERFIKDLSGADYEVADIQKKETRRHPLPPFTTSTLQQEANRYLGFSAKQTMVLAQQLYEGTELGGDGSIGLITYMRTDSVNLADKFLNESRQFISKSLGQNYLPPTPRRFTTKSKLAQEAHEAIRPTEVARHPEDIKQFLDEHQWKLYNLIWRRAVASQMVEAMLEGTTVDILAKIPLNPPLAKGETKEDFTFRATGSVIKFDGFLKVYGETKEEFLPVLKNNEALKLNSLDPKQHFTEPPARYSDATLVKTLEEYGIGRPSTYAPTISTIIERRYVERVENARLKPTEIGILVNDLLVEHFPRIVDYQFTAEMEDNLDAVAEGKKEWVPIIKDFFMPFKENLDKKYLEVNKKEITETATDEKCDKCGAPMIVKLGRYGKFLACGAFPKCRNIKSLQDKKAATGVTCPKCNEGEIVERRTKRGRTFYSCNRYPKCDFALWYKPTGEKCPRCQSLLVEKGKKIGCSKKECDYSKV
ncbi:MAG: type I DNA topoisomerase [bacterium]|nr:type I DNA topoisomerase [bacterium]